MLGTYFHRRRLHPDLSHLRQNAVLMRKVRPHRASASALSSCRNRRRAVGDTAANRLCSPNVRRARGARAVQCPHSGHERLHGHHDSGKTAECCGSCAGPDAGAEFMSAAWTPPAGSAQIRQGTCLGAMPALSGWNWQRTVCFRDGWIRHRAATPRGSGATIQELSVLSGAGLSCGTSMSRQVAPSPRVVAVGMTSPGPGRSLRLRDGCSHLAIWDSTD